VNWQIKKAKITSKLIIEILKRRNAVKNFYKKYSILQNMIFSICYNDNEALFKSPKNYRVINAFDL
jgi:hypothetical protein